MVEQVAIRRASADDINGVLWLWHQAECRTSPTDDVDGLRSLLRRDDSWLLLADAHGALIGSVIATWDGWRGNLYRLAVAPRVRRMHVALELVHEGERRLREAGARRITALVDGDDEVANRFWRSAGYELDSSMRRFARMLDA